MDRNFIENNFKPWKWVNHPFGGSHLFLLIQFYNMCILNLLRKGEI